MLNTQNEQNTAPNRMKIYFQFYRNTVSHELRGQIIAQNNALRQYDETLFALEFDPTVFTHAWQLLGRSPNRYGYDLTQYLSGTRDFFDRTAQSEVISLRSGTSDFRRRISEDLGSSLASLFMVESFQIEWHTISQIPLNTALSKTRPDFQGFTMNGDRYLYEAKGRTSPEKVVDAINKAIDQAKSYPEAAERKLALITYLSTNEHAFESHMFLADPNLPNTVLPDRETSEQLHLIKVLDFGGLTESRKAYIGLLRTRFAKKHAEQAGTLSQKHTTNILRARDTFLEICNQEMSPRNLLNFLKHQFRVRESITTECGYRFTAGVHSDVVRFAEEGETAKMVERSEIVNEQYTFTSLFTDGTLLRIERIDEGR